MTMTLYITVGSSDFDRSIRFYDGIFDVLGVARSPGWIDGWAGWGPPYEEGVSFWVCRPFDGRAPSPGNGCMVSLRAGSAAEVRAFHATALSLGGTDEGPPGTRPNYEPTFYVCYVRDPDGNKLACVYPTYDAAVAP
jgi:catechol 2,3-dioxygenase-like lactoylglutathione lyase family enzyme